MNEFHETKNDLFFRFFVNIKLKKLIFSWFDCNLTSTLSEFHMRLDETF